MSGHENLDLSHIRYEKLDDHVKGITINPEALFLQVEKKGKLLHIRLLDIYEPKFKPLTAWVKMLDFEDLKKTKSKRIREKLREWKNHEDILEHVLICLQNNEDAWNPDNSEELEQEIPKFSLNVQSEIDVEVERIKDSQNQLEALTPHLDNVLVGEKTTKQAILCLAISGKYRDPEKKQMILLKGESGGGKSTIQNGATIGLKTKCVGRFTEHGLDYQIWKATRF